MNAGGRVFMSRRFVARTLLLAAALAALTWIAAGDNGVITGIVTDGSQPLAGAVVRVQATAVLTTTDSHGQFTLTPATAGPVALTAFATGYFIAGPVVAKPGDTGVSFTLTKYSTVDDSSYAWVSAFASYGQAVNCQNCHSDSRQTPAQLPFDEWQRDAHGNSAQNRRFLSMYNGTDLSGQDQSPPTRYTYDRDYGMIPLPPNPNLPYYGPGFRLDFPSSAGNCAACHTPAAAVAAPLDTDPNIVSGVGKEGVACDFCHKVGSVQTDPASGVPYPNTPGVLSFGFLRPPTGAQFFAGPYDDVAPGDDTCSPLQNQSQFCAPCHTATFWGVQVYNSFGEWLASPYSDPIKGQTCQDCHMPHRGATLAALASTGGHTRDPNTVFSHLMPGASDLNLLQNTAGLVVEAHQSGPLIHVTVTVTNQKAGHHTPTDHPSRNILLAVSASAGNQPLIPYDGPVIPNWGGTGSTADDYGGTPGRGYAKILQELWTEVSPTVAYWSPTVLLADTRIPALGQDVSQYDFVAPAGGGMVRIAAKLLYRRAFRQLSLWKQWNVPDILMNQAAVSVDVSNAGIAPLAVVHAATLQAGAPLASQTIVTVYGVGLADSTAATGTAVGVRDRYGAEAEANLLYVSPGQINLVLPPGLAMGDAVLKVTRDGQPAGAASIVMAAVAPGLFTASGMATGPAAATVVSVAADGSQTVSPSFTCAAVGNCRTVPISIQPGGCYLMLFGTGIRGVGSVADVQVSVGGVAVPVLSAGPQSQFAGLDQVNIQLPSELAGKGEISVLLSAGGVTANTVFINVL
jgi:uncharacterized protein (TIGR03437 family)